MSLMYACRSEHEKLTLGMFRIHIIIISTRINVMYSLLKQDVGLGCTKGRVYISKRKSTGHHSQMEMQLH